MNRPPKPDPNPVQHKSRHCLHYEQVVMEAQQCLKPSFPNTIPMVSLDKTEPINLCIVLLIKI